MPVVLFHVHGIPEGIELFPAAIRKNTEASLKGNPVVLSDKDLLGILETENT